MEDNEALGQTLNANVLCFTQPPAAGETLHPHMQCEETNLERSDILPKFTCCNKMKPALHYLTMCFVSPVPALSLYHTVSLNNMNSASPNKIIKYEVIRIMMPIMVINNNQKGIKTLHVVTG